MEPMNPMRPMTPMAPIEHWWPDELGQPNSSGGQNELHFAFFADAHRLAVRTGRKMIIYDTGDHLINGVAQRQKNEEGGVTFSSQAGDVRLDDLRVVND